MKLPPVALVTAALCAAGALAVWAIVGTGADDTAPAAAAAPAARAALTVAVVSPQQGELRRLVSANGSIAPWQEAVIGAEVQGLRLAELRAGVGDRVRRGQVLAVFASDVLRAELAQAQAALAEAEAMAAEATADAQRARDLQASGALSAQQISQYLTAERTAQARVQARRAQLQLQQLRLGQTQLLAPDDGVISSRTATVGAVVGPGQELFRLIRQGRLEWLADVPAAALGQIRSGQPARLRLDGAGEVEGTVRMVAPTLDAGTRNGRVHVMLPATDAVKAGMFARGDFDIGASAGTTLPQSAVLLRDGFHYIFTVEPDGRVRQRKVSVGRRLGDRIEITSELGPDLRVVAAGAAFLADGDSVRVSAPAAAAPN